MAEITFSDVLIEPQYSEISTRSQVKLTTEFGKAQLELPVISANMKHVTGAKMCYNMYLSGALGILHRFNSIDEAIEEYEEAKGYIVDYEIENNIENAGKNAEYKFGVSIGVNEPDHERFEALYKAGARLFCIDVAHGHHVLMKNMLTWIRSVSSDKDKREVRIVAGNVATPIGALDLHKWGADIIKVGIGPGSVCQTRRNTGVGYPQLQALKNIREAAQEQGIVLHLIADGGIKSTGDIAKAMKYANSVMLGSFLAGTSETPGDVYEDKNGDFYKVYGGSASAENKVSSGKKNTFIEGMMTTVPFKGHVKYILVRIKENVQSACSYVGAHNLNEFRQKAVLKQISGGGRTESKI